MKMLDTRVGPRINAQETITPRNKDYGLTCVGSTPGYSWQNPPRVSTAQSTTNQTQLLPMRVATPTTTCASAVHLLSPYPVLHCHTLSYTVLPPPASNSQNKRLFGDIAIGAFREKKSKHPESQPPPPPPPNQIDVNSRLGPRRRWHRERVRMPHRLRNGRRCGRRQGPDAKQKDWPWAIRRAVVCGADVQGPTQAVPEETLKRVTRPNAGAPGVPRTMPPTRWSVRFAAVPHANPTEPAPASGSPPHVPLRHNPRHPVSGWQGTLATEPPPPQKTPSHRMQR